MVGYYILEVELVSKQSTYLVADAYASAACASAACAAAACAATACAAAACAAAASNCGCCCQT